MLATKITGYSDVLTWLRKDGGPVRLTAAQITEAVEGSLKRLGTDYIDLVQLHWPDRYLNLFGVDLYNVKVRAWRRGKAGAYDMEASRVSHGSTPSSL